MGLLHLVPITLLSIVAFWLLWPVLIDPLQKRLSAARRQRLQSADTLAESLFRAWSKGGRSAAFKSRQRG